MDAASKRSMLVKFWIQHWNPGEILTNFHVNSYFVAWKLTELDRKNEIWRCSMWASDSDAAVIQRCRGTLGKRAVLCPLERVWSCLKLFMISCGSESSKYMLGRLDTVAHTVPKCPILYLNKSWSTIFMKCWRGVFLSKNLFSESCSERPITKGAHPPGTQSAV